MSRQWKKTRKEKNRKKRGVDRLKVNGAHLNVLDKDIEYFTAIQYRTLAHDSLPLELEIHFEKHLNYVDASPQQDVKHQKTQKTFERRSVKGPPRETWGDGGPPVNDLNRKLQERDQLLLLQSLSPLPICSPSASRKSNRPTHKSPVKSAVS
ncbi:hypothetical protein ElyMa_000490400 [Elysia marginata]|uniref:Uncharacterized protein n=1 Tax=Elysia marginata TaxID=1093978 RepID=A0AAV4FVG5_9GAST|nr:hypothetical protein ElyMa_000490400 [Elysia marginata]